MATLGRLVFQYKDDVKMVIDANGKVSQYTQQITKMMPHPESTQM